LVERQNINNESEFVLQTESSYPYFQEYIQKAEEPDLRAEVHQEEQTLQAAHHLFLKLVRDIVNSVKSNPKLNKQQMSNKIKVELTGIRDLLLSLKIISIRLDDEDDAYLIFETLNTRGKDLALSDLVKNHFSKLLKVKNKGLDQPKEKWAQLRETIEGSKVQLVTDDFIHHYWLSKYDFLPAKSVYKALSKKVDKTNAASELQAMVDDAELYRAMHDTEYGKWTKQESEIQDALKALQLFRIKQQVPCVLALMRSYKADVIGKKLLERALKDIEKFHFQFSAITSQRSSGGISSMYASLGRRITSDKTSQAVATVINEMRDKLRERVPSEDEFIALFPELIYTNKLSKQRTLVKYVLINIAKHDKVPFAADYDNLTIEHIVPQSRIGQDKWTEENVGQLGNLLLVTQELNLKLKDKDFGAKKVILQEDGYKLPNAISNAKTWTSDLIQERTKELAKLSFNTVWKI
jgi:hypothetical protein